LENIVSDYRVLNQVDYEELVLKNLVHSGRTIFGFESLYRTDLKKSLPPMTEEIVEAVSRHADFALRGIAERCCGIKDSDTRRIFRSARTPKEALTLALHDGRLPPKLLNRL
jgi:hypothetical protein